MKNLFSCYYLPSTPLRKRQHRIFVILNEVKNLIISLDHSFDFAQDDSSR